MVRMRNRTPRCCQRTVFKKMTQDAKEHTEVESDLTKLLLRQELMTNKKASSMEKELTMCDPDL